MTHNLSDYKNITLYFILWICFLYLEDFGGKFDHLCICHGVTKVQYMFFVIFLYINEQLIDWSRRLENQKSVLCGTCSEINI
jgi:hypothetical protein